jgi:glutamyl-tRNA reductase
MVITLVGLNHITAPIQLREKLHISEPDLPTALKTLCARVSEGMIFSTCNRFEVLALQENLDSARQVLVEFIRDQSGIEESQFAESLYMHVGSDAIRHVFRVTSSLDSMVVGEPQILGQMKQFFAIAHEQQTIGFVLNSIMTRAFTVAKRVRSETLIASNAVSVSSVAVELVSKIFERPEGKTALIIGTGKMSILAIKHLQSRGVRTILVANRTFQKAAEVAEEIRGRAVPFESLIDCIAESDIVISSTGSSDFIIKKDHAVHAMNVRKNKPILLIDIAVPRDVDPQINQIDNIYLYDIDDLKKVAEANRRERQKEAEKGEEIVHRESEHFWKNLKTLDVVPTIREIQSRIDALRRHEINLTLKKLGSVSPEQAKAIEELTSSLTNKILQSSFAELKEHVHQQDGLEKIELIKKLFKLH